jgi:hypothetical protein
MVQACQIFRSLSRLFNWVQLHFLQIISPNLQHRVSTINFERTIQSNLQPCQLYLRSRTQCQSWRTLRTLASEPSRCGGGGRWGRAFQDHHWRLSRSRSGGSGCLVLLNLFIASTCPTTARSFPRPLPFPIWMFRMHASRLNGWTL